MSRAPERGHVWEVYRSGRACRIAELVDTFQQLCERQVALKSDQANLRSDDAKLTYGAAQKLRRNTGWSQQIPFQKTLEDLLYDPERMSSGQRAILQLGYGPVRAQDRSIGLLQRVSTEAADSHFISLALILGWETIKCQTKAWKDSVCGVIVSLLTMGTKTQASAT